MEACRKEKKKLEKAVKSSARASKKAQKTAQWLTHAADLTTSCAVRRNPQGRARKHQSRGAALGCNRRAAWGCEGVLQKLGDEEEVLTQCKGGEDCGFTLLRA